MIPRDYTSEWRERAKYYGEPPDAIRSAHDEFGTNWARPSKDNTGELR